MKSNRFKLIFGLAAVLLSFFAVTFFQKWDTTIAEKATDDSSAKVKSLKGNHIQAVRLCPKIIEKLEAGIPNLQKSNASDKLLKTYKLIADCQVAAHQYEAAAKNFGKLLEAEPQVARWHGSVAEALLNAGKPGDALPASRLAVQLDTNNFKYRLLEAQILAKLNLTNRAITAYREAIRVAPYEELEKTEAEFNNLILRINNNDIAR